LYFEKPVPWALLLLQEKILYSGLKLKLVGVSHLGCGDGLLCTSVAILSPEPEHPVVLIRLLIRRNIFFS
jgi:hypothetical protein